MTGAVIVVTGFYGGQAGAKRPLQFKISPAGEPLTRGLDRGVVDFPPDRVRQMRLTAVEVVHRLHIPQRADREAGLGTSSARLGPSLPTPSADAAFSSCRIEPSVKRYVLRNRSKS